MICVLYFSVSALKVRWKSLRDAYVKERKYDLAQTYGMKLRPKKPWRLKRQMEFLAPFIQMRKDFSGAETNSVPRVKSTKTPKTNINTTNYAPVPQMVRENDLAFNYDMNLFNQCIPKTNDQRFIEIDSFFRDIANAVKGLSPNSQVMLEKDITNLVMNYKLKELSDVRGLNG